MRIKKNVKKELGRWLLDVAKYILTGAVVLSFLGEFSERKWLYYTVGGVAITLCFILGAIILNKEEEE
jgi:multisubunit Na+/H+ antiporter MnhB subunit